MDKTDSRDFNKFWSKCGSYQRDDKIGDLSYTAAQLGWNGALTALNKKLLPILENGHKKIEVSAIIHLINELWEP